MKNKNKKTKYLGMPIDTARKKLKNNLLFDLASQLEYNVCHKCNNKISSPEALSVEHKIPWLDNDPNLFWDLNNVTFGHKNCKEKEKMTNNLIDITIEDENGKILPTYKHEGKIYIAGEKGERYNIRVKNKHSYLRTEVILTVDGRDVISGELGDPINTRGYIISANDDILVKGFRQTDNKVAAFRFSDPKDSYSDRMGSGVNVGVIGVAVYREYNIFQNLDLTPFTYTPYKPKKHNPWIEPYYYNPYHTFTSDEIKLGDSSSTVYGCSVRSVENKEIKTSGDLKLNSQSQIGTEYGESIESKVEKTNFSRENKSVPNEMLTLTYDTFEGLKNRGVIKESTEPNPFPAMPQVSPGYAPPPPKK